MKATIVVFMAVTLCCRAAETEVKNHLDFSSVMRCGPNALLMLAVLLKVDDIKTVRIGEMKVGRDGVSLLEMRDTARAIGLDAEVMKYRSEDIDKVPLPAIAQLFTSSDNISMMHYDVMYNVDSMYVYTLDGTTAQRSKIRREKLPQFWRGYALVVRHNTFGDWAIITGISCIPFVVAWSVKAGRIRKTVKT